MSINKPIFASQLGQIGEIIEDGVSGVLLPPGNIDALVEALLKFSKEPSQFAEMGKAARTRVLERYTWVRHWETILSVFRNRPETQRTF